MTDLVNSRDAGATSLFFRPKAQGAAWLDFAIYAAWVAIVLFQVVHHVMWRDEVRALSIALAGDGFPAMLRGLHGEGHPAVWYVSRRISIEREHACDDLVISTGWRPLDYCRALIGLAEACAMPRQPLVVAPISISAFGRGSSDFRQRILRLAGESAESKPQLTRSGFSGLAAVLGILILVSIAFRSHRDSKTESPKVIDSRDIARRDSIVDATPLVNAEGTDAAGESDFVMNELLVDVLIEGNSTIQSSEIAKHIKASIGDKVTS